MRILVTNDDGVDSPGLLALAAALDAAGHDVLVVAPAGDRSGASAAIGPLHRAGPIPVVAHSWPQLAHVRVMAIDTPPATAVYGALLGGFGEPPELVVAGINPGANTGHLVLHSGTVGAALTAVGLGVPGLAVSMARSETDEYEWATASTLAVAAVPWTADLANGPRVLNLNVPNCPLADLRGVREATLSVYGEVWVASADASSGDLRLEFKGSARDPAPGSDVALVRDGYASVTPLLGIERASGSGAAEAITSRLAH